MMDSLDIHLDRNELTVLLSTQIEDTEEKVILQERQDLKRDILQKHINGPPSKKIKGTIKVERNEEYIEQGESSSEVAEENASLTAAQKEQHQREFEKLVAEYPFAPYMTKRNRHDIIQSLRIKYHKNKGNLKALNKQKGKIRVAIDCSFDNLMKHKQIKTLSSQMQSCYSLNRTMTKPLQLLFTNFKDETLKHFNTELFDYKGWDVFIREETLTELYSVNEVVYLCASSENVIQTLDDDKVYVIGGYVPPRQGVILKKAKAEGFNTARLPVLEYFIYHNINEVYSVPDLFKIIASFSTLDCWVEAIKSSIPNINWVVRKNDAEEEMRLQKNEIKILQLDKHEGPIIKMSESTNKIRIAIDCSFDSRMNPLKVTRMCSLIQQCYSFNRNMTQPVQLYVTHFKDKTLKCFNDHFPLYKDWDIFIKEETLTELYSLSEIVYLCPESENVLQTLDGDKIYVIAGFAYDARRIKAQRSVLKKAKEAGFNTARLPIQEHFSMPLSTVLTIIDVFQILAKFSLLGCWKKAISGCPDIMKKGLLEKS